MPSATPLSEEQQRRIAAVIALVREIADVSSLDDLVSALLQAAAVWYDIDARGFRRAADGSFELAALLPGATAPESERVLCREVVGQYPELTRVSTSASLEALGSHEASGELLVLPLPSGADPLWVLTFTEGALADAEPVIRGLTPLLDMVIDRWRLKSKAALHGQVLGAMSRALASGASAVALGIDALRCALDAEGARLSIRNEDGATRLVASSGMVPQPPQHSGTSRSSGEIATVSFALGHRGTAVLELAFAASTGIARAAAFADVGRSIFVPWLAGAMADPSPLAPSATACEIADLAPRIRDEINNAARFGRGTALLSIAFVRGAVSETAGFDEARRATVKALARVLRRDDAVGQIVGADLVVLVTDVTPDALLHASERVRRVLASAHLSGRAPAAVIGTAVFPADGMVPDQLMDVARSHAARQIAAMSESN